MGIDITFVVIMLYGIYLGFKKGVFKAILTLLMVGLSLIVSMKLTPFITDGIQTNILDIPLMSIVVFILTFFAIMLLFHLGSKLIQGLLNLKDSGLINRICGAALYGLLMLFMFSTILRFGVRSQIVNEHQQEASICYPLVKDVPETGFAILRNFVPLVNNFWMYLTNSEDENVSEYQEESQEGHPTKF